MVKEGNKAPAFNLESTSGEKISTYEVKVEDGKVNI